MTSLTAEARNTIKWYREGVTIAGYTRHYFPDGRWHGDRCGCVDDRCIGYHHDGQDECCCLSAWLDDYYLEALADEWLVLEVTGDGKGWMGPLGDEVREVGKWLYRPHADQARENWAASGYVASVKTVTRASREQSS